MTRVPDKSLQTYRARTYKTAPGTRLQTLDDALAFVEARGFATLWPIQSFDLPSLWTAVAGDRPVADEHDDPGHITWSWKDQMLDKRQWYYGKLLRGKATLVSLEVIPVFYALSDRVAEIDDYRLAYEDGHLTYEAYRVAEALLRNGPQHTIQLRRLAHLSAGQSKSRFNKAIADLQRGLWVVPIGIAEAGAWRYAFIYELFDRWFTNVAAQARPITLADARTTLACRYLDSVGAATAQDIGRLFRWRIKETDKALQKLADESLAVPCEDKRWATAKLWDGSPRME
ncbi:MAG: crosslink repair DNA glycosylase YcaQ family protein [Anaerolineales bacterium]|jgi:hypothetical protein